MAPPCGTSSRARLRQWKGAPPILRTDRDPDGVAGLSTNMQSRVDKANLLYKICTLVCRHCHAKGILYSVKILSTLGHGGQPPLKPRILGPSPRLWHNAFEASLNQLGFHFLLPDCRTWTMSCKLPEHTQASKPGKDCLRLCLSSAK